MRNSWFKCGASAAVVAISLLAPAAAQAQTTGTETPATDGQNKGDASESFQDIVVTAQRRAENINDVGVTIQAFSGDTLRSAGISDAAGLAQITPAFNFARSSANTPIYTIRGIGFQTPNLSSTSPVGVYVDEVAYAYPYMSNGPSFDVERVEILKGPQGTLYGRNTTGGLVNYIAAKPTADFSTGFTLELGNYETINAEGYVSLPIAPTLGLRVSGRWETSGKGWQKSVSRPGDRLGEKDRLGARAILEWEPTSALRLTLSGSYWDDNSDTIAVQAVAFTPDSPPFAVPGLAAAVRTDWKAGEAEWGPNYTGKPSYRARSRFYGLSGRLDYELSPDITFTSLTGYNDVKRYDMNDVDGTPFETSEYLSDGRIKSFSQELRLTGSGGSLDWIVGGYYSRDNIRDDQIGYYRDSSILNTLAFVGGQIPQNVYTPAQVANGFNNFRNLSSQRSRSLSGFANADFRLSEQWKLSAGIRYTDDSLSFRGCSADFNNNTAPVWNTGVAAVVAQRTGRPFQSPGVGPNECLTYRADFSGRDPIYVRSLDEDNFAGRLAVNWEPNDDTLIYASVSRGYKSGAFPVVAANVETQLDPAKQEKVTAYELGLKASLADRAVQANVSGYYYDYRDKQLFGEIQDPIFSSLARIINVPESRVWGGEVDISIRPTDALFLKLGGSYTNTRVIDFVGFNRLGQPRDFAGSAFPYTPKWQFNALATYDVAFGGDNAVQFGANMSHQGSTPGALGEDPDFDVAAYMIVNANITFKLKDDRFRLGVFGRNLFNENYYTASDLLTDTVIRVPGMVRTYGVTLSVRY